MIQIAALRSRLEKQPTDLRPYASYIRDDALESKKAPSGGCFRKPGNFGLSRYSIRFYDWAKKHAEAKTKTIPLEELRRVLGLKSVYHALPAPKGDRSGVSVRVALGRRRRRPRWRS
jgi:hypothetical protein